LQETGGKKMAVENLDGWRWIPYIAKRSWLRLFYRRQSRPGKIKSQFQMIGKSQINAVNKMIVNNGFRLVRLLHSLEQSIIAININIKFSHFKKLL